jgi:hypothetical protein
LENSILAFGRGPVLTLQAAGLLDLDAGEIVRPGILRIEGGMRRYSISAS